jgi:hypothetical protein
MGDFTEIYHSHSLAFFIFSGNFNELHYIEGLYDTGALGLGVEGRLRLGIRHRNSSRALFQES